MTDWTSATHDSLGADAVETAEGFRFMRWMLAYQARGFARQRKEIRALRYRLLHPPLKRHGGRRERAGAPDPSVAFPRQAR